MYSKQKLDNGDKILEILLHFIILKQNFFNW